MKRAICIFWLLLVHFSSIASSFDVFKENGKVGLRDADGKIVIPAKYDALGWSKSPFKVIDNVVGFKEGGFWGLISLDNKIITRTQFEDLNPGTGSLLIARKKSNLSLRMVTGCLTTAGREVLPFLYDGVTINGMRAIVYTYIGNQYRYGLVDLDNRALIPQQYQSIKPVGSLRFAVQNFDNKTALFSDAGKQMTAFSIDSISNYKKNFAIIYQNTSQGLLDVQGDVRVQPVYREMKIEDDGSVFHRDIDEWSFLDGQNQLLYKKNADIIKPIDKNLLQVSVSGAVQLTDDALKPISNSVFASLDDFHGDVAAYSTSGKYGIARRNGTVVLSARYDKLVRDHDFFLAGLSMGEKESWTLLDKDGNALSSKSYEQILPYTGRIFPVVNRKFWGALDENGKEVIACAYDSIVQQLGDLVVVKFKGQYGIIGLPEVWKITPKSNRIRLISADRFLEQDGKTTFLKSLDGSTIYFTDNRTELMPTHLVEHIPSGALWQIDFDGVIVNRKIQPDGSIERVYPETEGLRGIKKNGQYGFVDSQNRLRIANRYEGIEPFSESLAAARIRGHWGFINHEDKIAIQPVYDAVSAFHNGVAIVKQKGFQGLIDKTGKLLLLPRYESVEVLRSGNVLIKQGGLYGLADKDGNILINPKYQSLEDEGNNYVIVQREGKFGVVSSKGISTIPLVYDQITFNPHSGQFLALKKSAWVKVN
jgi:hypothetical protein